MYGKDNREEGAGEGNLLHTPNNFVFSTIVYVLMLTGAYFSRAILVFNNAECRSLHKPKIDV